LPVLFATSPGFGTFKMIDALVIHNDLRVMTNADFANLADRRAPFP
jgi:hypothetical protein